MWDVSIPFAIGLGDRTQAMSLTNQMVKMKGSLDENGRKWVDRQWWSLRVGWEQVDNVIPRMNRDEIMTIYHTMAESENVDMTQGMPRTIAVNDPHKLHFDMHMKSAADVLQKTMNQQMQPEQGLTAFKLHVQHIVPHVSMMGQDETRANQVAEAEAAVKQLIQSSKQLENIVKQRQQQQKAAQEAEQARIAKLEKQPTDREMQLGMYKIDKEAEVKSKDVDMQNQQRISKAMTSIQTKYDETAAKIDIMYREAEAKIAKMFKEAEKKGSDDNE
jgi:hypothetical protein